MIPQLLGAVAISLIAGPAVNAQVLLSEQFTGGASTTGFTIESTDSDCDWTYAPGGLSATTFSVDGTGEVPSGAGFDGDFAFLDSDACGGNAVVVNSTLVSPTFDASAAANVVLSFSHQFQARQASFCKVEVYNGSVWTQVALYTVTSVGYPNPAAETTINITAEAGGSSAAQVRFQFNSGWDWWWALDDIEVTALDCYFPGGLAVVDITTTGATISWTDNGSQGYEWVVTTGALPDGSNAVASGDGTNTAVTGLSSGVPYTVFIRAQCPGGEFSGWSGGVNFAIAIENDECDTAIPLVVNTDYECGTATAGTITAATPSGVTSTCFGTADDDVWFSFTALATYHRISLIDVVGPTTDLYHAVWSGACGSLTLLPNSCSDADISNPTGLVPGQMYYVQVYSWTSTPAQSSTFNVCVGSDPAIGIGIGEIDALPALSVFPNPAADQVNLTYPGPTNGMVHLLDATGRVVRKLPFARTVDVGGMEQGAYLILVVGRDGRILARSPFVKE